MATTVQALITEAARHIGARYDSGGGRTWQASLANPPSFDCSGFIKYLGLRTGAGDPGNVSDTQFQNAQRAGLAVQDMNVARRTPGVLLFKPGQGNQGHVAMVYNSNGDTIEATGHGGVRIIKGGADKSYFTRAAMMAGVDYSGGTVPATTIGQVPMPDSSIAPAGSNDVGSDPAYHLGVMAALMSGVKPEDIAAQAPTIGAVFTPDSPSSTNGANFAGSTDSTQWAKDFLTAGGYPTTEANIRAIKAWQQAEGTTAAHNPLATTQSATGATDFNHIGVKNYTNYNQGIDATLHTVKQQNFKGISDALMAGNDPYAVGSAIANSNWGTGRGVLNVLGPPSG